MREFAIVIHGGAGTILREEMHPELEQTYLLALEAAVDAGFGVLESGGTAVDAVAAAVVVLEDNERFNAGKGSVFTSDGLQEMDAAIMDGRTLAAGAVAGVRNIRNPVLLAQKVMTNSDHVFLSGEGAQQFAETQRLGTEPDAYFFSQFRYDQWQAMQGTEGYSLDHNSSNAMADKEKKYGTVGAVACDQYGNVASATSTGGMTNKRFGRIGDSPVIGAGTYANNRTCAISCTGHGELFIKAVAAYDVHARMAYRTEELLPAMESTVEYLRTIGGEGGMIGVDAKANTAMIFNSAGMYRAIRHSNGEKTIAIYK